jgi:carboxylesterase
VPVKPGAEPFSHDGGPLGVLLCQGFTGSPASMRPWADFLAAKGCSVRLPRLPGHGTTWQEMQKSRWQDWYAEVERGLLELHGRCQTVVVGGLSMGGTLSLRLAEQHPDKVAGLALVNPSVQSENKALLALPLLKLVVPSLPGISNDIAKPGQDEIAYDRMPLKALASLTELWKLTKADLGAITCPLILFRSAEDHVVEASNAAYILANVGSTDTEEQLLHRSYHVATLDYDAASIFDGSLAFAERVAAAGSSGS